MGGQSGRSLGMGALLALLALAFNVLCPPGFMVAARGAAPAIVICTGHGPAALPDPAGKAAHRSGKTSHIAPCAFAGHGLAGTAPASGVGLGVVFAPAPLAQMVPADRTPGRGLAAPPPPSHAPPVLI